MTPPQEPDDEPVGEERPDQVSADDAVWRSIVDNYGERAEIVEPEIVVPPSLRDLDSASLPAVDGEPGEVEPPEEHEAHFVPPTPPPLPTPPPARLIAWIGLFGVPAFVLVALVAGLDLAGWVGLILMVWFVGGFVFLVASMRPRPDDYDDGARL